MKDIKDMINEAIVTPREYSVQFVGGPQDEEGLPITFKLVLEEPTRDRARPVEAWLKKEQDNTFIHVDGKNVEY